MLGFVQRWQQYAFTAVPRCRSACLSIVDGSSMRIHVRCNVREMAAQKSSVGQQLQELVAATANTEHWNPSTVAAQLRDLANQLDTLSAGGDAAEESGGAAHDFSSMPHIPSAQCIESHLTATTCLIACNMPISLISLLETSNIGTLPDLQHCSCQVMKLITIGWNAAIKHQPLSRWSKPRSRDEVRGCCCPANTQPALLSVWSLAKSIEAVKSPCLPACLCRFSAVGFQQISSAAHCPGTYVPGLAVSRLCTASRYR